LALVPPAGVVVGWDNDDVAEDCPQAAPPAAKSPLAITAVASLMVVLLAMLPSLVQIDGAC